MEAADVASSTSNNSGVPVIKCEPRVDAPADRLYRLNRCVSTRRLTAACSVYRHHRSVPRTYHLFADGSGQAISRDDLLMTEREMKLWLKEPVRAPSSRPSVFAACRISMIVLLFAPFRCGPFFSRPTHTTGRNVHSHCHLVGSLAHPRGESRRRQSGDLDR